MTDTTLTAEAHPLRSRIDSMFARDRAAATILIVALWATILFVLIAMRPFMTHEVEVVCWLSAAVLLLFNTASIVAMTRHYAADKDHIYGIDIKHLDAGR